MTQAQCALDFFVHHRDGEVWPDPERFDPDRFLPEAIKTRPPCAFAAFGAGPRRCIGEGMAMDLGVYLIAELVRRFQLSVPPGEAPPTPILRLTMRSDRGIWLRVEPVRGV